MELRDYQLAAADAVEQDWRSNELSAPVVQLPTGTGKTVVLAELARRVVARGGRVLLGVNRDELCRQSIDKLQAAMPEQHVGLVQGPCDQWPARVVVGSIQTISRTNRLARIPENQFDVIIADEMQFSASPSWQRVFAHFGDARLVGFSATPARNDKVGLGDTWSSTVFERDVAWAIEKGHLVRPLGHVAAVEGFSLEGAKTSRSDYGTDYQNSEVSERLRTAHAPEAVARAYREVATGDDGLPRRGIIFAPDVRSAIEFMAAFCAAGIATEVVVGSTPIEQRQAAYARVVSGETRVLASVMVLSVGFDLPCVEVAVMARATKSKPLYIQQAGRALRPSPATGKRDALIIDVCGVSALGLACFADLRASKPAGESPFSERMPGERGPSEPIELVPFVDLRPFDPITGKRTGEGSYRAGERDWMTSWGDMPFLPTAGEDEPVLFMSRTLTVAGDSWTGWSAFDGESQAVAFGPHDDVARTLVSMHKPLPRSWANEAATDSQRRYARMRGISLPPEATKLDASKAISLRKISRAIDATVPHVNRTAS